MTDPNKSVLKVRRSIYIVAPPESVWTAFASKARMDLWWGKQIGEAVAGKPNGQKIAEYEPRLGGKLIMEVSFGGAPTRYGGAIVVFEPARAFTIENDWIPNQGWTQPTFITIRLSPALNGTLVELFHHGFERAGATAEFEGYEQGWGMLQLSSLRALIESEN